MNIFSSAFYFVERLLCQWNYGVSPAIKKHSCANCRVSFRSGCALSWGV